jgi:hypothetical protein
MYEVKQNHPHIKYQEVNAWSLNLGDIVLREGRLQPVQYVQRTLKGVENPFHVIIVGFENSQPLEIREDDKDTKFTRIIVWG